MNWLNVLSDLSTIATAAVAVYAYSSYRRALSTRVKAVESVLATSRDKSPFDGSLTLEQVAAPLNLTIEQVLDAASRSSKIEGVPDLQRNQRKLRHIRKAK